MHIVLDSRTDFRPGPDLAIDCPHCHTPGASAYSYDRIETLWLFDLVPVARMSSTYVNCRSCEVQLRSRVAARDLQEYAAAGGLARVLIYDPFAVSCVAKAVAIVALLFSFLPTVGTALAIVAFCMTRKSQGWPRVVSIIAIVLSLSSLVLFEFCHP
jgi:hypothetical protein